MIIELDAPHAIRIAGASETSALGPGTPIRAHWLVRQRESAHENSMTLDEFAQLQTNDLVECAGIERRVVRNYGHEIDLTDAEGVLTVPRESAGRICLLYRANPESRVFDDPWVSVSAHLMLVNLVRARIGQRPIDKRSGYSPADVEADAVFYATTQTWARARARELGIR